MISCRHVINVQMNSFFEKPFSQMQFWRPNIRKMSTFKIFSLYFRKFLTTSSAKNVINFIKRSNLKNTNTKPNLKFAFLRKRSFLYKI